MDQDLTYKYRPLRFEDFWCQRGIVTMMPRIIESRSLPRSTILTGIWGCGKTSLAELVGQKASCLKVTERNPCYECLGCQFVDTRIATYGGRFKVYGGNFKFDELQRFCNNCQVYPAPDPYHIWVPIVDEVQFLDINIQQRVVNLLDSIDTARFIFCTSDLNKVEEAIRKRSQIFEMPTPTEEEAVVATLAIAKAEGIPVTRAVAEQIAAAKTNNPRDCTNLLQLMKGTGQTSLPQDDDRADRLVF
ncbi:MAG TPA: hypothetical protein VEJ63_14475 [Planctomycetota bacterium]|nr:hypothetical protein [Planctomycetota bacterium]